jgi:NTE family protein
MWDIENLVFKGGGVLGVAYAGAIEVLEKKGVLKKIKRVSGTSVGSVIAILVALKYNSKEIKDILKYTNLKDFEDNLNPLKITTKYGLYDGDVLLNWIKGLIKKKTGNENTTFAEMNSNEYLDLKVYSTDLTDAKLKEFSNKCTPNVIVAESIRASISIPLVFSAWKFTNKIPDDHLYVDGGVLNNYPINSFEELDKTLGFFLEIKEDNESLEYNEFNKYLEQLFKILMQNQTTSFLANQKQVDATIFIKNLGISSTNFKLTEKEKTALFNEGVKSTIKYFR